jgi:hypothetical protein
MFEKKNVLLAGEGLLNACISRLKTCLNSLFGSWRENHESGQLRFRVAWFRFRAGLGKNRPISLLHFHDKK